jgi:hypothetical protein
MELLQQRPEICERLQQSRMLLATLDFYANQLKATHEIWKQRLFQAKPSSGEIQIASEALEIALQEMEDFLASAFPPKEG